MTALTDLPSTRSHVFHLLQEQGPLTVTQLQDRANMGRSTVYRCIRDLEDADLITDRKPSDDRRETLYEVRNVSE